MISQIMTCFFTLTIAVLPLFGQEPVENQAAPPAVEQDPYPFAEELRRAEEFGDSRFVSELIHMLVWLGLLVGVLFLGIWLLRRMTNVRIQQQNTTSSIKVLEQRALSNKSSLFLVEVEGKSVLLAESLNGVTLLASTPVESWESEE